MRMSKIVVRDPRELIRRYFPERQLFVRSRGEVVFLRLGTTAQLAIAAVLVAAGAWVVYASASLVMFENIVVAKDQRIAELATAYRSLGQELESTRERFLDITEELEGKHRQLLELVEQRTALEEQLGETRHELDGVVAERDQFMTMERALSTRIAELEGHLRGAAETTDGPGALAGDADEDESRLESRLVGVEERLLDLILERDSARSTGLRMTGQVDQLEQRLVQLGDVESRFGSVTAERDKALRRGRTMSGHVTRLERRLVQLDGVEARLVDLIAERDLAIENARELTERVGELEVRLADVMHSQRQMIARIQERTEINLEEIEEMIALTGLSVDKLLKGSIPPATGLGGPFIMLSDEAVRASEFAGLGNFESSVIKLERHLNRWAGLQDVLERLPMTSPMDTYYVASAYGKRRDPFTKKWAMHYGIDLAGSFKSPVWSTAPGTVTFAGRKGPYGKIVEIDHGYGLVTRYGHLSKILVKKGTEVGFRHKIGVMGSTGRSTGSHVHYEIVFDGEAQDPAKFMKAGKYVFKD